MNTLKTTELDTLKGSLLYVNYLTNGKEERGRETNSYKKIRLTPDFIHSLDPVIPKAIFIPDLPHYAGPRDSSFQFTLVFTESPSFTSKGIAAIIFAADKCHDFQKTSRMQFTHPCQRP